jgi:hypothetical protein
MLYYLVPIGNFRSSKCTCILRTDSSVPRIDVPTDNIAIKQIIVEIGFFLFFSLAGSDRIRWVSRSKFKLQAPRARTNFG